MRKEKGSIFTKSPAKPEIHLPNARKATTHMGSPLELNDEICDQKTDDGVRPAADREIRAWAIGDRCPAKRGAQ